MFINIYANFHQLRCLFHRKRNRRNQLLNLFSSNSGIKTRKFDISNLKKVDYKKMMSSLLSSSNPAVNPSTRRKKKKKINQNPQIQPENPQIEWKSEAQQQIYSSKLLHALQQVRLGSSGPRGVREAAYGVLAATARGRTRWSRAILTSRLKLKFMKKNSMARRQRKVMTVIANQQRRKSKVGVLRLRSKCLPAFQRKARVLSRLVPGCRKQPLPVVLEETTDYIAALQMQVRAMSALAELLTVSGSSSSSTAS